MEKVTGYLFLAGIICLVVSGWFFSPGWGFVSTGLVLLLLSYFSFGYLEVGDDSTPPDMTTNLDEADGDLDGLWNDVWSKRDQKDN